jgi:hypothetical protein
MTIPTDRPTFEGEIATYWIQDGILVSLSKPITRTVENIKGNIALVKQITGSKRMPLLIYLTNSPVPDKATRKFSAENVGTIYSAMAMVSKPGLAKLIMNLVFALKPPSIPMKSFSNDQEAKQWLKPFIGK